MSSQDLAVGPNGNVPVSSEYPFGALGAATPVREYDQVAGSLVRVFRAWRSSSLCGRGFGSGIRLQHGTPPRRHRAASAPERARHRVLQILNHRSKSTGVTISWINR
jgi:hypothetical protein